MIVHRSLFIVNPGGGYRDLLKDQGVDLDDVDYMLFFPQPSWDWEYDEFEQKYYPSEVPYLYRLTDAPCNVIWYREIEWNGETGALAVMHHA